MGVGEAILEKDDRLEEYQSKQIDTGEQSVIDQWTSPPEPSLDTPDVNGQTEWSDWT